MGNPPCPVIIKIPEFAFDSKKKLKMKKNGMMTPSTLTTRVYKMCLRVDSAGHGKGKSTHLSVFLYLMEVPVPHGWST